jgi:hypothetical protein
MALHYFTPPILCLPWGLCLFSDSLYFALLRIFSSKIHGLRKARLFCSASANLACISLNLFPKKISTEELSSLPSSARDMIFRNSDSEESSIDR